MFRQAGLDLPQLDTETADLHLEVVAPQKLDVAVGKIPAQVPRPVHPRSRLIHKWIPEEPLRGQLRTVQISPRYPRPPDVQLSSYPLRDRLTLPVQYVHPRVRNRSTNRDCLVAPQASACHRRLRMTVVSVGPYTLISCVAAWFCHTSAIEPWMPELLRQQLNSAIDATVYSFRIAISLAEESHGESW